MVMKVHGQFQTKLQAEGLGILLQFWARTKIYLLRNARASSGAHPAPYLMGTMLFPQW